MIAAEWSDAVLEDLHQVLFAGDTGALHLWIAVHVGVDRQAWRTLAIVLASIAAASVESHLDAQLRAAGIDPGRADILPVILYAGKDVENRSRSLGPYRGPVLIHASKQAVPMDGPGDEAWDVPAYRDAMAREGAWTRHRIDVRGAIIGVVELLETHPASDCWGADGEDRGCSPWAEPTGFHLTLAAPRALQQPLAWTGGLGLRKAPQLALVGDWLAMAVDSCTCHGPTSGPHEPGCGVEPLVQLVGAGVRP